MSNYWILDGHVPVASGVMEWGRWFEAHQDGRIVCQTIGTYKDGSTYTVSTVFVGIDLDFVAGRPPRLFETMVFGTDVDCGDPETRYSTWDEALAGHMAIVYRLQVEDV